ncbi:MAG: nucleotidyltransferase family protein [Nitrospinota bacterium]
MTGRASLEIPQEKITAFCRKWKVTEFCLFGSILREDFGPESDVDVLVSFERDAKWSLFDIVNMQGELTEIFGRKVDLVERKAIEQSSNPFRKRHILNNLERVLIG